WKTGASSISGLACRLVLAAPNTRHRTRSGERRLTTTASTSRSNSNNNRSAGLTDRCLLDRVAEACGGYNRWNDLGCAWQRVRRDGEILALRFCGTARGRVVSLVYIYVIIVKFLGLDLCILSL